MKWLRYPTAVNASKMTLSHITAIWCSLSLSDENDYQSGDLAIATEPAVLNFIISLVGCFIFPLNGTKCSSCLCLSFSALVTCLRNQHALLSCKLFHDTLLTILKNKQKFIYWYEERENKYDKSMPSNITTQKCHPIQIQCALWNTL